MRTVYNLSGIFIDFSWTVINRVVNTFSTGFWTKMLISSNPTSLLKERLNERLEIYCSGLFLSARWFVLSQAVDSGTHFIIMPNQESAEYCSADLYNLLEGDKVFYLPSSGKSVERSNYKSSLGVQRTAARHIFLFFFAPV